MLNIEKIRASLVDRQLLYLDNMYVAQRFVIRLLTPLLRSVKSRLTKVYKKCDTIDDTDLEIIFIASHMGATKSNIIPLIEELQKTRRIGILTTFELYTKHEIQSLTNVSVDVAREPGIAFKWLSFSKKSYSEYIGRRIRLYEEDVLELLKSNKNAFVVNHSDFSLIGGAAIIAARKMSRKEFTIQHGIVSREFFPIVTGNYFVWGDYFKRQMTEISRDYCNFKVLGAISMDKYFEISSEEKIAKRIETRKLLNIPDEKQVNLFISNSQSPIVPRSTHRSALRLAREATLSNHVELLRRLHPQEIGFRKFLFGKKQNKIQSISIENLILASDIVTGVSSTVLIEALALGIPTFQVFPRNYVRPDAPSMPDEFTISNLHQYSSKFNINFYEAQLQINMEILLKDLLVNCGFSTDVIGKQLEAICEK